MRGAREAIREGRFKAYAASVRAQWPPGAEGDDVEKES